MCRHMGLTNSVSVQNKRPWCIATINASVGLDVSNQVIPRQQQQQQQQTVAVGTDTSHNSSDHWGENRLADVVKGTAKAKNSGNNGSGREAGLDNESPPRPTSPQPNTHLGGGGRQQDFVECKDAATGCEDVNAGLVAITPPSSPERLVTCRYNHIFI